MFEYVAGDLHKDQELIRREAAQAVQSLLKKNPERCGEALNVIDKLYKELSQFEPAHFDNVGRIVREEKDPLERRSGIANGKFDIAQVFFLQIFAKSLAQCSKSKTI